MPSAAGSTAKPASSSERTISPHASPAAAGSGSTSTSRGHVASASPRRICGRTPAASAAAVTGPSSGSPPGSGASAAGRTARAGVRRSAAFSSSPGMERQAIKERMFYTNIRSPVKLTLRGELELADHVLELFRRVRQLLGGCGDLLRRGGGLLGRSGHLLGAGRRLLGDRCDV